MVTRKRINLSLAELDFERLGELAAKEGKTLSTFALDALKVLIHRPGYSAFSGAKRASEPVLKVSEGVGRVEALKSLKAPEIQMSRQQRRLLERKQAKKGGK
jgi:hypothetical protein